MLRIDISDAARRSGYPPSTLRYYEKLGLIKSDGRQGLRRQYDDSVLNQLALISLGQRAGFSLEEMSHLLQPKNGQLESSRNELRKQAQNLRDQAAELKATATLLDHVAACSAQSHLDCPRFQTLLMQAKAAKA